MNEHEDSEKGAGGFKVVDKRRFTSTGDVRRDAPADEPAVASAGNGARGASASSTANGGRTASDTARDASRSGGSTGQPQSQVRGTAGSGRSDPRSGPAAADAQQPSYRVSFLEFVASLATNAMASLGMLPDAERAGVPVNFELAREYIDIIAMLNDKTRGNLTRDEEMAMQRLLTDLRMHFLQRTQGGGAPGMGGPGARRPPGR